MKRPYRAMCMILIVSLLIAAIPMPDGQVRTASASTSSQTASMLPTDDALIRGGIHADTGYGGANTIAVSNYHNENGQRMSYLKFNVSHLNIDEVTRATLKLYASDRGGSAGPTTHQIYGLTDTSWEQSSMTWNQSPNHTATGHTVTDIGQSAFLIDEQTVEAINRYYEFDLGPYIQEQVQSGRTAISLLIAGKLQDSVIIVYNSKENNAFKPELELEYTGPSSDASLMQITIDGQPLSEFHPDRLSYDLMLPSDSALHVIQAAASHASASIAITQPAQFPGEALISVVAEDGVTELVYQLWIDRYSSDDITLRNLTINGTHLAQYRPHRHQYVIRLDYGTADPPYIAAEAVDPAATVAVQQATAIPGTATVFVTAGDGATSASYVLQLESPDVQTIWQTIGERKEEAVRAIFENPFPEVHTHPLGNLAYGLSALWLQEDMAQANQLLADVHVQWPTLEDPTKSDGDIVSYFGMPLIQRILYLFGDQSDFYAGRLSPSTEAALKEYMWTYVKQRSKVADTAYTDGFWHIKGSENHDIIRRSSYLLTAQLLKDDPDYAGMLLGDGHTLEAHYEAWNQHMHNYFEQRAQKGISIEFGSPTYSKYTLEAVYNLHDFAQDSRLSQLAGQYLDIWYAEYAIESMNGIRGGAKTRVYKDRYSYRPLLDTTTTNAYVMFNSLPVMLGGANFHPSGLASVTSEYVVPRQVVDLAVRLEERGSFAYISTVPGLGTRVTDPHDGFLYTFEFPAHIRKYTYVTPGYISGAFTVDPTKEYTALNEQNRWMGIIFNSPLREAPSSFDSRVYAQVTGTAQGNRTAYNEMNGIANGGAIIVQRMAAARNAGDMRIYFSEDLYHSRAEEDGWVFAYVPEGTGYIAVKPAKGAIASWADEPGGKWMQLSDSSSPVVLQAGLADDYASFEHFKAADKSSAFYWLDADTFVYEGLDQAGELTWHADHQRLPRIDGVEVDLASPMLMDSPYLQSEYNSGVIEITDTTGSTRIVDFTMNEE